MSAVLIKAFSFIFIIVLGYILKQVGFFKENDYKIISKVLINITLPCAIIYAFADFKRNNSMFFIILLGFLCSLIPMIITFLITYKKSKDIRAFYMINVSGFNIGCFTLPFAQNFFGSVGIVVACMFDIGNAIMMTGGSYAITSSLLHTNEKEADSFKSIIKKFIYSVPFDIYIIMLLISILNIKIPNSIMTIISPVASANSFLAMILIGMMFEAKISLDNIYNVIGVIILRIFFGISFSLFMYFFMPFPIEIRRVLAIVSFSPISSLAPIYTEKCKSNTALSCFASSVSIFVGLIIITFMIMFLSL